jgi:hypothetical protein
VKIDPARFKIDPSVPWYSVDYLRRAVEETGEMVAWLISFRTDSGDEAAVRWAIRGVAAARCLGEYTAPEEGAC